MWNIQVFLLLTLLALTVLADGEQGGSLSEGSQQGPKPAVHTEESSQTPTEDVKAKIPEATTESHKNQAENEKEPNLKLGGGIEEPKPKLTENASEPKEGTDNTDEKDEVAGVKGETKPVMQEGGAKEILKDDKEGNPIERSTEAEEGGEKTHGHTDGDQKAVHKESDEEMLASIFQSKIDIWSKDYLKSKIKIRLVLKTWKPWGPSNLTEEVTDIYKWDKNVAAESLTKSSEKTASYTFEELPLEKAEQFFASKNFNKDQPNIMIIHPISANADVGFVRTTIAALAMRNLHLAYNIFAIDMPQLNFNMFYSTLMYYMQKQPMFEPVAEVLGDFFVEGSQKGHMKPDEIHLIGFSYSGQLVGYMGRYIKTMTKQDIGSILSLEPIGSANNRMCRPLSKLDAKVVHVYHTNAFPIGSVERLGTADFVFNNGIVQPECRSNANPWMCSHLKVVHRFWYVILYGPNLFKARKCPLSLKFNFGVCNSQPTAMMTYPIGHNDAVGSHFIMTLGQPPYGLGEDGCTAPPGTKKKLLEYIEDQQKTAAPKIDKELLKMLLIG